MLLSLLLLLASCAPPPLCATTGHVNVTRSELDAPIHELQWFGDDAQVVFAVTNAHTLYRSTNGGRVFYAQTKHLPNVTAPTYPSNGVHSVWASADQSSLIITGLGGFIWASEDRGTTYRDFDLGAVTVQKVEMHPSDAKKALLLVVANECALGAAAGCYNALLYTSDLLRTPPVLLATHVEQAQWEAVGGSCDASRASEPMACGVLLTTWPLLLLRDAPNVNQPELPREKVQLERRGTVAATDASYFAQRWVLAEGVSAFLVSDAVLFVASFIDAAAVATSSLALYVATDGGALLQKSALKRVELPRAAATVDALREEAYRIVHVDGTQVFINVQHEDYGWGNLYKTANVRSQMPSFELVLERHALDLYGSPDFLAMRGLPGIFLANVRANTGSLFGLFEDKVTVMTRNHGATWHRLPKPASAACFDCSVHLSGVAKPRLHMAFDAPPWYGPLHSKANTVALAIGSGNVGDALVEARGYQSMFVTRDAGASWEIAMNGTLTYDFADHGALIVAAAYTYPSTKTVAYSGDEGASWRECDVDAGAAFSVHDVVADPAAVAEQVLVHGATTTEAGVVYHLDFAAFQPRACGADDYEEWSPGCVDGRDVTYRRRRRAAACHNERELDEATVTRRCACTLDDYECDAGFVNAYADQVTAAGASGGGGGGGGGGQATPALRCVRDVENGTGDAGVVKPPVVCHTRYLVSSGYRLRENTQCDPDAAGARNYEATSYPCPADADGGGGGGGVAALVVLLLLLGVGGAAFLVYYWRRRRALPSDLSYVSVVNDGGDDDDGGGCVVNLVEDDVSAAATTTSTTTSTATAAAAAYDDEEEEPTRRKKKAAAGGASRAKAKANTVSSSDLLSSEDSEDEFNPRA